MNDAKIGDGPWGCLVVFAVIGIISAIYILAIFCNWVYNHVSIN